jgi:DNA-binding response OmpR family regulator
VTAPDLVVHPAPPSPGLADAMSSAGLPYTTVDHLQQEGPLDWDLLIVELGDEPLRRLRMIERLAEQSAVPVLAVVDRTQVGLVESAPGVSDFVLIPVGEVELAVRVRRLTRQAGADEVLEFKDLRLNVLTYQAALGGHPLDLTFMEYELLRFFVEHHGRAWSREQLLSKVWGYEYYGGARTVDVHVRRLRSKLGESRASWITTVRSVGYRFG